MDFEVSYNLDSEEQFWEELDGILASPCYTHELIDNNLRAYLALTTNFKGEYLKSEYDVARCSLRLIDSSLFQANDDYVRRQIVYGLLQEDDAPTLHMIAALLLYDGRSHEETLEMMQNEGIFPRLVELIQSWGAGKDDVLHRMLLDLLYEMSRIQRLTWDDLSAVDDAFVVYLFNIIESLSADACDPYHYPVIRVLLVLNEQYMVASALHPDSPVRLTNRVIKAISSHLSSYKTFGENLILLLNRESETSLQLLILKLLYLLFNTNSTAEYFYTNDLHVLLDVILRNLLDLPADAGQNTDPVRPAPLQALRHTYLRVLFPLLANSQLRRPGMAYRPNEVLKVLHVLNGESSVSSHHFAPTDETTLRLVTRCLEVPWLKALDERKGAEDGGRTLSSSPEDPRDASSVARAAQDRLGAGSEEIARRTLGMSVRHGGESALSVLAVAEHTERPGVLTPSRRLGDGAGNDNDNGSRNGSIGINTLNHT